MRQDIHLPGLDALGFCERLKNAPAFSGLSVIPPTAQAEIKRG